MGMLDRLVDAVTPKESAAERDQAHRRARSAASQGDWLWLVVRQHERILEAFEAVMLAVGANARRSAQRELEVLLTAHSVAEEAVLYPAMARMDDETHATRAYAEQAAAKMQAASLEMLDPLQQSYMNRLDTLREAVAHHMYEEESSWFLRLQRATPELDQRRLTLRYMEEYNRYLNGAGEAQPGFDVPRDRDEPPVLHS